MYGPDYEIGACPGCTNSPRVRGIVAPHAEARRHPDVLLAAPIDRLVAYKERMGGSSLMSRPTDRLSVRLRLALSEEQAEGIPSSRERRAAAGTASVLASQVRAELKTACASPWLHRIRLRERDRLRHRHRTAPAPSSPPTSSLLLIDAEKPQPDAPLNYRNDEYRIDA